jgi:D-cysteine desulfhydrase
MAPKEGPIYVALGSGSTAAGLALGLVLANRPRPIKAIQVTSSVVVNRFVLNRLLIAGAKLLVGPEQQKELVSKAAQLIEIDNQMLGRGYGHPTSQSEIALDEARRDELLLDPIYTSKVFAAIQHSPQDGMPILYWHTDSFPLAVSDSSLSLPEWYQKAKLKAVTKLSKG